MVDRTTKLLLALTAVALWGLLLHRLAAPVLLEAAASQPQPGNVPALAAVVSPTQQYTLFLAQNGRISAFGYDGERGKFALQGQILYDQRSTTRLREQGRR